MPLRWGNRCGACPLGSGRTPPGPRPCVPLLLTREQPGRKLLGGSHVLGRKSRQNGPSPPFTALPALVSSAKGESRWTSCCRCPHGQASPPAAAALVGAQTPFPSFPPAAGIFLNDPGRREESVLTQQPPGLGSFQGGRWFRGPCPQPGWTWGLGHAAPGPPASRVCPAIARVLQVDSSGRHSQPSSVPLVFLVIQLRSFKVTLGT